MSDLRPRIVVLISGSGSNLQAIIDATNNGALNAEVCAVISNNDEVMGLERAERHKIPAFVVNHKVFPDRNTFDNKLIEIIDTQQPDLVVLAGFMRILTPRFTDHYKGRLLNIHPSLLPKYQGLDTHQRALDAGDAEHGVSVHFVTEELDGGPLIAQAKVRIDAEDTVQTLADKVRAQEHILYPLVIKWFCEGRLKMQGSSCYLDDNEIPPSGLSYSEH